MNIGMVSLNQVWENKEANKELCKKYFIRASECDVNLLIFPEMTLTGFSTNVHSIAEDVETSLTVSTFKQMAKKYNVSCIFGVVFSDSNKFYNKSVYLDDKGNVLGIYAKIHPFSFAGENQFYMGGSDLCVVNDGGQRIGLTICYDLRFPELYTALSKDCDVVVNIANWPKKRIEHWKTLLKARAIENQIYIVGVNRVGIDGNNLEYEESSCVFNANGDEIKYINLSDSMKVARIDAGWTKDFRKHFLTVKDRNTKLYKEII